MGNRILKSGICQNEKIEALSLFAETVFYRLIVNCDDYGRFSGDARVIKGMLFCLREGLPREEIEHALDELESVGLIFRYTVAKKPYLCLCGWEEHQKLRYRKEVYPSPAEADGAAEEESTEAPLGIEHGELYVEEGQSPQESCCDEMPSNVAHTRINNNIIYNFKEEEKKSEAEEKKKEDLFLIPPYPPKRGAKVAMGAEKDFERFWAAYPRKERREAARRAFLRISPKGALLERMLSSVAAFKQSDQWQRDAGRYVPHPARWLRECRWEELPLDTYVQTGCDGEGKHTVGSFDTDDFFAAALKHSARCIGYTEMPACG